MDAKHKDALRELEIAALRGHPDGYATSDCTVTYKEAADALRAALARIDELDALREQLDAAQTALVDAETVKRERDALRAKIAKLRGLARRPGDPCCLRLMRDMLAILDEVNNEAST